MSNERLTGGLFLGCLLLVSTCAPSENKAKSPDGVARKKKAPALKKSIASSGAATTARERSKALSRYGSCDELQGAVYRALSLKKQNDAEVLAAQQRWARKARQNLRRRSGRAERVTESAEARPQAAKAQAARAPGKKSARAPKRASKKLAQFTNIQEVGVDEPDHVKIGPHNVYLLRGLEIQLANRRTLKHQGHVQLKKLSKAKKLLITAQHLFVLGESKERICRGGLRPRKANLRKPTKRSRWGLTSLWRLLVPEAHAEPGFTGRVRRRMHRRLAKRPACFTRTDTVVQAYGLRSDGPPQFIRSWHLKGRYVDARMTAGRIVLIFRQQLNLLPQLRAVLSNASASLANTVIPKRPLQLDRHKASTLLSCGAIYRSEMADQDYRLTKVVAINAKELTEKPKQAGFVGGGDQIYMSTENLYIAKAGVRWKPRQAGKLDSRSKAAREREMRDALSITQIGFSPRSGEISVLAQTDGTLRGRPKDQWAFKELLHQGKSLLGVFTTTGKMWSKAREDATNNHLWILRREGSKLSVAAKLSDIAPGESIRSVRYLGKWAYAVTFKKTDPLFAIDLSNALEPKIVGQLKIPGFSTYMHPIGGGRLIGIGFDVYEDKASSGAASVKFQGIKLSLFDISNPRDMRELDTMVFGERGSYSDVTADHHAFFYDAKRKRLAFPLTLLKGTSKTEKWKNKRQITFAGAVLVQVGGKRLRELAKWRHNRWIPETCYDEMQKGRWWEAKTESQDINRIYRMAGKYLTASRYGLKTYSVNTPQRTKQKLHFPGEFADCGIGRTKN